MSRAAVFALALVMLFALMLTVSPARIALFNTLGVMQRRADDATNYKTLKTVEDTCRAMIASYEADRLTWEQYHDDTSAEKQGWAEQAKMRANKTASSYNNYILKNSFVWAGNVPGDIRSELEVLR